MRPLLLSASLCSLLLLSSSLQAASAQASPEDRAPIITDVRFEGNDTFADEVLAVQVRTRPNRRFLEIPGATWWLWLYRLGEAGTLGRRLSRGLLASGEAPAYLDTALVAADVERLRIFYRQEGFRQADVQARVDTLGEGRHARITFAIEKGPATQLRRVRYEGVGALSAEQREELVRTSYLRPPRGAPGDSLAFRPRGQRYSEPALQLERQRLLAFLRNRGYAAVSRDSIRAVVIPGRLDSFDVVFRISPGLRYRFGDVRFQVTGPEEEPPRADTLGVVRAASDTAGVITVRIEDEEKLNPRVLTRSLRIEPGDYYDQSRVLDTKRQLEGTGLFTYSDVSAAEIDSASGSGEPRLSHVIDLRTRRRHSVRLETFLFQRQSSVTEGPDASFEPRLGAGLTYQNANLLGAGETFQVSATGSIDEALNSPQAELSTSLTYPYLTWPAGPLERKLDLYDARTRFSFSLLTARLEDRKLIIKGRGAARARLELQHTPTVTSLIDLPDYTLNNPDTLTGFTAEFLNEIITGNTDPVQRAQIIEDYTVPSVNSAARYTLRSVDVNPLLRNRGYSFEGSAEIGGTSVYLLDRFVFTPGTVEGYLPSLPIFRSADTDPDSLVYRRYVRVLGDYRRYHALSRSRVFAWRAAAGAAQPLFGTDVVPFDRRFYTGGASGVRGWDLRALGPGPTSTYLGGEVRLESAAELRIRFLRNVFTADWSYVLFTDAGNVWIGPRSPGPPEARFKFGQFYKQIGVGSGVGLRVAWEFFIARLDLAYKLYDPAYETVTGASGLQDTRGRGFLRGRPTLHFGIGHAF